MASPPIARALLAMLALTATGCAPASVEVAPVAPAPPAPPAPTAPVAPTAPPAPTAPVAPTAPPAPTPPAPAPPAPAAPITSASSAPAGVIALGRGLVVDRAAGEVRMDAQVALERGWLEQAVCKAGTREHESLLATEVPASRLHAALLLLGAEPGQPGRWREVAGTDGAFTVERIPPSGTPLAIWVRVDGRDTPLAAWITDPVRGQRFPDQPWVFAGSRTRPNTPSMGPGEHYVADYTGSIVGIVTFGDEVIACAEVFADRAEVEAPEWQAKPDAMPVSGTAVTLVIRIRPQD